MKTPLKTPEMFLSYRAPRFSDLPPPKFLGATVATVSANSTRLGAADQPWLHQIECFPGLVCGGSQCVFFWGVGLKHLKPRIVDWLCFPPWWDTTSVPHLLTEPLVCLQESWILFIHILWPSIRGKLFFSVIRCCSLSLLIFRQAIWEWITRQPCGDLAIPF